MNDYRIVIIHGLNSKPEKSELKRRYVRHLNEATDPRVVAAERIGVAYWAQLMGYEPLTAEEDSYSDGVGNFKPYSFLESLLFRRKTVLAGPARDAIEGRLGQFLKAGAAGNAEVLERLKAEALSGALDRVARRIYDRFLPDLDRYFNEGLREAVKDVLRRELDEVPESTPVCLIAHSMGSIIALDLILSGTRKIDTFITIGSPIGLSVLQKQVGLTPQNRPGLDAKIGDWFNLYDRLDKVALDSDLVDDFPEAGPLDISIRNTYVGKDGERNHHKVYGYLRSPELGEIVRDFIAGA